MNEAGLQQYDGPPPGTPCCVCHTAGHFCQADEWLSGEKHSGICFPCREMKDCEISAAKRKAEARKAPAGVEVPAPLPTVVISPGYKPQIRQRAATMLKQGYGTQTVMDRTGLSKNSVLDLKRELGMPVPEPKADSRATSKAGAPRQEEKREAIKKMIDEGASVRSTAEVLSVSTNTVQSVKRETRETKVQFSAGKSVHLKSGGVLTISGSFNLFGLNQADRQFVCELIDKLESYG